MELSLSKLPWWGQIGAFVAGVRRGGVRLLALLRGRDAGRRHAAPDAADGARGGHRPRRGHRAPAAGVRIAGRSARAAPREPQAGAARGEGRRRHPAPHPGAGDAVEPVDSALHAAGSRCSRRSTPRFRTACRPKGRTTTSGSSSIASASSRESSTSARSRSSAKTPPEPDATIIAECVATTFVLQEAAAGATRRAARVVPKAAVGGEVSAYDAHTIRYSPSGSPSR